MHRELLVPILLLAVAAWPVPAPAATLEVPLALDYRILQQALAERLFHGSGETAELYADSQHCNHLELGQPRVGATGQGRLLLRTTMRAQTGTPLFGRCWFAKPWHGLVEIEQAIEVHPATSTLSFRVVDSALLRGEAGEALLPGFVERWIEQYAYPRLAAVTLDLSPVVAGLQELLDLALAGAQPGEADQPLARLVPLRLAGADAAPDRLVVTLALEVPDFLPPEQAAEEAPLTAEELARWDASWQNWDAFATWTIKVLAAASGPDLAQALAETLLAARYDLRDALERDQRDRDPVRELFLQTWERLAPLVQEVQLGLPGGQALPYAAFVSAGDALQALDQAAPQLGIRLDRHALRRMARLLAPGVEEAELQYDAEVDPELRALLGLDPEFEEEPPVDPGDADGADAAEPDHNGGGGVMAWLFGFIGEAVAAPLPPDTLSQLHGWVPERPEVDRYLALVDRLLDAVARAEHERGKVPAAYQDLYDNLLRATAWQESCWRQYVMRDGQVETIRSPAGSVGLMQVNLNVWRGVYDPGALVDNVGYNVRAGNEILAHYLVDYAIRKGEHRASADPDGLARATYAAYNGGPGHLSRYRKPGTPATLRKIDEAFLSKYRAIQADGAAAVKRCLLG